MGVHLYTNGAWTDSGKIYRNSVNLYSSAIEQGTLSSINNGFPSESSSRIRSANFINLEAGTYTFKCSSTIPTKTFIFIYAYPVVDFIERIPEVWADIPFTFTLSERRNIKIVVASDPPTSEIPLTPEMVSELMLNSGSIALPYEPYNVVDWYTNNGNTYSSGAWS